MRQKKKRKNAHGIGQPVAVGGVLLRRVALVRLYGSPVSAPSAAGAPALSLLLEAFHAERLAAARRLEACLDAQDRRQHRDGYRYGYRSLRAKVSDRIHAFQKKKDARFTCAPNSSWLRDEGWAPIELLSSTTPL